MAVVQTTRRMTGYFTLFGFIRGQSLTELERRVGYPAIPALEMKDGLEQFNAQKGARRAATAHTAQAIHLSQQIFGVNPLSGSDDSLLFVR